MFQILWTFSIYLESVAILPQLFLVSKTGEAESITSHYLFALGSYRALYLLNWVRYIILLKYKPVLTALSVLIYLCILIINVIMYLQISCFINLIMIIHGHGFEFECLSCLETGLYVIAYLVHFYLCVRYLKSCNNAYFCCYICNSFG